MSKVGSPEAWAEFSRRLNEMGEDSAQNAMNTIGSEWYDGPRGKGMRNAIRAVTTNFSRYQIDEETGLPMCLCGGRPMVDEDLDPVTCDDCGTMCPDELVWGVVMGFQKSDDHE